MRKRPLKLRLTDVVLFVSFAAVVAVVSVVVGCGLDIDRSATADTPPLTLSLSASSHCETSAARGFYSSHQNPDPDNEGQWISSERGRRLGPGRRDSGTVDGDGRQALVSTDDRWRATGCVGRTRGCERHRVSQLRVVV